MSFVTYDCKTCGAGIDVQPDNLLTICAYCGNIHPAKDIGDVPVHIVPSRSQQDIVAAVHHRMAHDRDMKGKKYTIETVEGVYVPLYVNYVHVQGMWRGYRRETHNKKTVQVWQDGMIQQAGDFPVPARKHAHEFGLGPLGKALLHCQPVPFRTIQWESAALPVLAVDLSEQECDWQVADDLLDMLGEQIREHNKLHAITEFNARPTIQSRFILLYPLWTVIYVCRGGSYRVAVEGGQPSVLAAMEPVFFHQRIFRFIGALALTICTGFIWYVGWWLLFLSNSDDVAKAGLAVMAVMIGAMLWAWKLAGKMVASVNIEGIGEGKKKRSWLRRLMS